MIKPRKGPFSASCASLKRPLLGCEHMLGNKPYLIGQLSRPIRTANQRRCNLTQNECHQPRGVEAEWIENQVHKTSLSGQANIETSLSTTIRICIYFYNSHPILHLLRRKSSPLTNLTITTIINMTVKATTCCRQGTDAECACAQKATCSCGEKSALHCTCAKADTENVLEGPRCSCRARPAGQCTCDRASTENAPVSGSTCQCGARPAAACTCEKAADGSYNPANEIDFTNFAK